MSYADTPRSSLAPAHRSSTLVAVSPEKPSASGELGACVSGVLTDPPELELELVVCAGPPSAEDSEPPPPPQDARKSRDAQSTLRRRGKHFMTRPHCVTSTRQ
jgi:hypothetical protein